MASGGAAAAAVQASESERGGVDERKLQWRGRRTRSGAPGVQADACAPCGGRALPARHGGTARPAVAHGRGRGRWEGEGTLVGWAGFGQ